MGRLNENSSTVFEMGAALVGSALPNEHKADMAMLGQGVSLILKNRFYQQQADDFKNNELAAFQQKSSEFGTNFSMIEDPNQRVGALQDYKNSVMVPFISSTSLKYHNNPAIMSTAEAVFKMGPQLQDYISAGNLKNDTDQVAIAQQNANTNAREAQTRRTGLAHEMATAGPIDPNMSPEELLKHIRNHPKGAEMDQTSFDMMARRDTENRYTQYDPARKQNFGNFTQSGGVDPVTGQPIEGDIDRSKALLAQDKDLFDRALEFSRGIKLVGLDVMKAKFPDQYDDVMPMVTGTMPKPPTLKMKGPVADKVIAGVFSNQPSSGVLGENIEEYTQWIRTTKDPIQLGDRFFGTMAATISVKNDVMYKGGTEEPIEFKGTGAQNLVKFRKLFRDQFDQLITNDLTSNDSSSISTRRKLGQIADAAIDTYIVDWAKHYGVNIASPRVGRGKNEVIPKKKTPGVLDKLDGLDAAAKGILRNVTSGGIFQ